MFFMIWGCVLVCLGLEGWAFELWERVGVLVGGKVWKERIYRVINL